MKSIITTNNVTTTPFPKLMITDDGMIVYFKQDSYGQVIHQGKGLWEEGCISGGWDMDSFHDFPGSVTLSND